MTFKKTLEKLNQKVDVKHAESFIEYTKSNPNKTTKKMKMFIKSETESLKKELATLKAENKTLMASLANTKPSFKKTTAKAPAEASIIKQTVFVDPTLAAISREQFKALSPAGKSEFSRNGGKISN